MKFGTAAAVAYCCDVKEKVREMAFWSWQDSLLALLFSIGAVMMLKAQVGVLIAGAVLGHLRYHVSDQNKEQGHLHRMTGEWMLSATPVRLVREKGFEVHTLHQVQKSQKLLNWQRLQKSQKALKNSTVTKMVSLYKQPRSTDQTKDYTADETGAETAAVTHASMLDYTADEAGAETAAVTHAAMLI